MDQLVFVQNDIKRSFVYDMEIEKVILSMTLRGEVLKSIRKVLIYVSTTSNLLKK